MTTKILYGELITNKTIEEVKVAVKKSFQIVGGEIQDTESGIQIIKGTNQVKYAFTTMKFYALLNINQISEGKYEIACKINWTLHWFHLFMFIWGFGLIITWIYNILYFLVNPTPIYQQAIDRVKFYLE